MKAFRYVTAVYVFCGLVFLLCVSDGDTRSEGRGEQRRRKGFLISQRVYSGVPLVAPLTRGAVQDSMPAHYSLKRYMPSPGDQGDHPTNAAWAVAYGAFTCLKALESNDTDPAGITAMAFSPGYLYAVAMRDSASKCEKGIGITEALDALESRGTVGLKDFPDECEKAPPDILKTQAWGNRISAYRRLFGDREIRKELALKKSLVGRSPVVAAMWYVSSFDDAEETWAPTNEESYRVFGERDTGVAVTVVGYDDNRFGGAFEVMNSQGTGWGKGGFCWIRYGVFNQFCAQAFQMIVDTAFGAGRDIQVPDIVFAPTPDEATISGSVRFLDLYQSEMTATRDSGKFRLNESLASGSKFKIQIAANLEAFVYILSSDDVYRHTSTIFPDSRFYSGDHLNPNSQLILPPVGMGYIELDTTAGVDHFCVLFSSRHIDIAELSRRIDEGNGPFVARVQAALSGACVSAQDVVYSDYGSLSFWTAEKQKSVVMLFIDLQHTRQ